MTSLADEITMKVGPPTAITLYFCPHCGRLVVGSYKIDRSRKKCSKLWHSAVARPVRYVRENRDG